MTTGRGKTDALPPASNRRERQRHFGTAHSELDVTARDVIYQGHQSRCHRDDCASAANDIRPSNTNHVMFSRLQMTATFTMLNSRDKGYLSGKR
jgi:hypothetical protein